MINFLTKKWLKITPIPIEEEILVKDLFKNKTVTLTLNREKGSFVKNLGDFEIDLTSFYLEDHENVDFVSVLRNHKEFRTRPNYMSTDMRSRG